MMHQNSCQSAIQRAAHSASEYRTPSLTVLGDMRLLTETGSAMGDEDNNPMSPGCQGQVNTMFNMC